MILLIVLLLIIKKTKMSSRLYIIGNGFDIYHGINSRYSNFKDYVEENDNDLYEMLEEYFDTVSLWSDFEETLAYIDVDTIVDDAENYLVSYGADDWSDAYHHDYQYEIQRVVDIVTKQLKKHFTDWILQLDIPNNPQLTLEKRAKFLTFNYTDTLESVYNVPVNNIVYIHNKAVNQDSVLILGHSRNPANTNSFREQNDEDTDPRVAEGNYILDEYFSDTYKNTATLINDYQDYFNGLSTIKEIYLLGHSISPVDIEYFRIMKNMVDSDAIWKVSYYGDEQRQENMDKIANLGVDRSKIEMITLDEI